MQKQFTDCMLFAMQPHQPVIIGILLGHCLVRVLCFKNDKGQVTRQISQDFDFTELSNVFEFVLNVADKQECDILLLPWYYES